MNFEHPMENERPRQGRVVYSPRAVQTIEHILDSLTGNGSRRGVGPTDGFDASFMTLEPLLT